MKTYDGPIEGVIWKPLKKYHDARGFFDSLPGQPNIGRRVVFDARLALTLRHHGVTEFATRNEIHFTGFGFARVWNPLAASLA